MYYLDVTIEDHVVPQLLTSALEAYEIFQPNGKKKEDKLETFGLLWGYVLPKRAGRNPRVVATFATVETSALRANDSVQPDIASLKMKIEVVGKYWPHFEVVGTFHSHPYASIKEVRDCKGWQASAPQKKENDECDLNFWPWLHEELFPNTPYLAHLIVTITSMEKKGWALPKQIEQASGFEFSMGSRKIWITSYGTEIDEEDEQEFEYSMMEYQPTLDIPSLVMRVIDGN